MITPRFTRNYDDTITVDSFPAETICTLEFLRSAFAWGWFERRWRTVTIRCSNATAVYRIVGRGPYPRSYHLRKVI